MLRTEWARDRWHWPLATVALVAACSFQDFEYLQVPADEPAGGSSGSGGGGTGGDAGEAGAGTGGRGGSQTTGGQGGSGNAGQGGTVATGGTAGSETGGTGDMGGAGAGGESTGGTSGKGGSGGTGATGQLVNGSFETFSTAGWTIDPASAATNRYVFVQAPTGTVPAPDGAFELAMWHQTDAYTFEFYQRVTGLEDGTYTFSGSFSRGDLNEAYLFARDCGGSDPEPVPIPVTSSLAFEVFSITGIEVSGGSCEVGFHADANAANWMNADKFILEPE